MDRLLVGVILLALFVRLAVLVHFRTYQIPGEGDHWSFGYETGRLARSLATGEGFSSPMPEPSGPSAFLPLGYPLLLSGLFRLFGVYTTSAAVAALLLNILFSTLTCAGVYLLGQRIFGRPTGLVASAVLALHPPSIWYAVTTFWNTTLLALALVVAMLSVYWLPEVPSLLRMAATGVILGVVAWIDPGPLPFYAALVFLLSRRFRARSLHAGARIAVLSACCLLVYAPWMVRNLVTVGVFAPRTGVGMNLRLGNTERMWTEATGGYDNRCYPSESREESRQFHQLGEVGYDRRCRRLAMAFIRENPGKFAQLIWFKFRAWWFGLGMTRVDKLATPEQRRLVLLSTPILRWLMALVPASLLVVGCVVSLRKAKPVGPLIALVLIYPLPYYVFFAAQRYRFPIDPFVVLLSAYGTVSAWSWLAAGAFFRRIGSAATSR
jgi:4-amino-4-deoxy-L-arabinose transferase-like glycosyltransferase